MCLLFSFHGHLASYLLVVGLTPITTTLSLNLAIKHLFKPGACRPQAGAPGFLELLLSANVGMLVCVCVRPRGY